MAPSDQWHQRINAALTTSRKDRSGQIKPESRSSVNLVTANRPPFSQASKDQDGTTERALDSDLTAVIIQSWSAFGLRQNRNAETDQRDTKPVRPLARILESANDSGSVGSEQTLRGLQQHGPVSAGLDVAMLAYNDRRWQDADDSAPSRSVSI